MAYVPYRVRRKLKNGTWATFLVASQSDLCLRFTTAGAENGTVETALASLESKAVPVNLATKQDGFITVADKRKLDGIEANANKYIHPAHTARTSGLYKITVDTYGHVTAATKVTKADITALGIPSQDTTYNIFGAASASAAGTKGLVPAPAAGDQAKYLRGDGTWGAIAAGKQISFATSQPTDQAVDDLWAEPL